MTDQNKINEFFSTTYPYPLLETLLHKKSGIQIANKILPTETVIDIGCGKNYYKRYIKNLIGIDPATDEADYKVSLQDFITDKKFDVALCLGSIHYGDKEFIDQQISRVVNLLNPTGRIYWRCLAATLSGLGWTTFPWTADDHIYFAKKYGFIIKTLEEEIHPTQPTRLYVEWIR